MQPSPLLPSAMAQIKADTTNSAIQQQMMPSVQRGLGRLGPHTPLSHNVRLLLTMLLALVSTSEVGSATPRLHCLKT